MSSKEMCKACDEPAVESGLCDECIEYATYCDACKTWYSQESDKCRHLFWSSYGWAGAGSCEVDWGKFKLPFFALLDVLAVSTPWMPNDEYADVITGMQKEICRHRFWTKTVGPMLGTPDLMFYRLRPDLPKDKGQVQALYFALYRPSDLSKLDDEDVGEGFSWLQSLCADDTVEANRQTVKWIEEWRRAREQVLREKGGTG